jgi:hypothetical protein
MTARAEAGVGPIPSVVERTIAAEFCAAAEERLRATNSEEALSALSALEALVAQIDAVRGEALHVSNGRAELIADINKRHARRNITKEGIKVCYSGSNGDVKRTSCSQATRRFGRARPRATSISWP